ncbi:apolipoprotein N-acyltransferase [Roseibacterium sp. SDUM158017]|uniref:apolipoprotein N-acyltransferase n=1 Tax=Roseicyclus salinarum TaxID=3036773 RepID=UPI002414E0D7|nr:apolipoprotein N-acyltransferase [Roseibacterium sp. SDUM158017]MDG4649532.1 apolipoprotein N-acyltransferase [Roseibacterium sp. SDUM158017]
MRPAGGLAASLEGLRGRAALPAAFASGLLAGLGQAPFDLWLAMPLGLAALALLVALAPDARAGFLRGLAGGAGHFALSLHWIVEPFFVDAARHGWMAPFALVLFAVGLALFWAAAGWGTLRLARGTMPRIALFAPLLTLAEVVRSTALTGFPWALPGHALIDTPWLQLGGLLGAHGMTLAVTLVASLWAAALLDRRAALAAALGLPVLFAPYVLPVAQAPQAGSDAPVVRLVQPNAPQHLKWREDMIPVFWQRGRDLTAAPADPDLGTPDLVVWPETSLPVLLGRSDVARLQLSQAAGAAQVMVGVQRFEDFTVRNSLAVLDPGGSVTALYDKHHLVPFGEYVPLQGLAERLDIRALAAVMPAGYRPGPGPAALDLGPRLGRAFPMICYEAIFPGYIRDLPRRPDWMAHVTNDAWFGTFSGPWQHLALARLRAAEQGLPVLRAANTGVSAVIDARGRVVRSLGLGEAGVIDARLPPPAPPTPYARWGDLPALLLTLALACAIMFAARRTSR